MGKKRAMHRTKGQYPDGELEFSNYESLICKTKPELLVKTELNLTTAD